MLRRSFLKSTGVLMVAGCIGVAASKPAPPAAKKLETVQHAGDDLVTMNPGQTADSGGLMYFDGVTWTALPKGGTAGQVLMMQGATNPTWVSYKWLKKT